MIDYEDASKLSQFFVGYEEWETITTPEFSGSQTRAYLNIKDTTVLIDNIAMLYDKGKINGALIVAPKGVYKNWLESEIPNHLPNHIEKKIGFWQTKPEAPDMLELLKPDEDLHICIMNVEAFSTKKGLKYAWKFLNSHRALVGIDESTTIKNPTAKRTKAILDIARLSKYRRVIK